MISNEDSKDAKDSKPQQLDRILISRLEAASLLSISPRTIDNLIRSRQLRPRRVGSRVLFLRSDLELFAKRVAKSA